MKKPDLGKYKTTSVLYLLLLLVIGIVLFLGWKHTSISLNDRSADSHISILTPTDESQLSAATSFYELSHVSWTQEAPVLMFYTQHQTVVVRADGVLLYTRGLRNDSILHTTGRDCERITIPANTQQIQIILTNCNPGKSVSAPVFYQGDGVYLFRHELMKSAFPLVLGILNIALGILMLSYWIFVHRWAYVSKSLFYLGLFTTELGAWFCLETGAAILLLKNPVFRSYASRTLLLLLPIPFLMFVRHYLKTTDRYLWKILLWTDVAEIVLVILLQFTGIADLVDTLWMTHLMLGLSVFYFIFTIIRKFYHHALSHALWICTIGSLILISALFSDLISYYTGSQAVGPAGRIAMLLFIITLACDTAFISLKEIDDGRRASLYREMAEKDLLTGCYNQNAYHNDTSGHQNLTGLLFIAFDLNNLKYYNDQFGHDCGDRYITASAHILQKVFSRYGKVYRTGGDEFCVLIHDGHSCDINRLISLMQKEETHYNASSNDLQIQIACGYAVFDPLTDSNLAALQKRADRQMYKNKKETKTFSYR